MSLSLNYPNLAPSLLLDFAGTKKLDPRITFTRSTTASYYDGITTAKAEQNLLLQSQDFSTDWTNQNTTETSGATAPDGTATAFTLDDGVATGAHDISGTFSGTSGTTYTLSAFFKDIDRQYVILACSAGPNTWASAKFDLTAGTAGSTSAAGSGWSTTSSSITSVGNSWYRCTITFVSGSTATLSARLGMATDGTTFTAAQRGLESYTGTNATVEIWGAQLEQRSAVTAYTATTTQPITNYVPVLQTAASGVARFDHNPTTGESLGLLVEEQRTNLLYQSAFGTIDTVAGNNKWYKTSAELDTTTNFAVSPDGTLSAALLAANTNTAFKVIFQRTALTTGGTYAYSVFAKALSTDTNIRLLLGGDVSVINHLRADFTLSGNGTASNATAVGTAVSGGTPSIQAVGNGWYRCTIISTLTAPTNITALIYPGNPSAQTTASQTLVWGAQLEAGAFPTSYIPTTSATVTRNADAASMTGTNFSSWYRADEGTVFIEADRGYLGNYSGYPNIFAINDNTTSNEISIYGAATSTQTTPLVIVSNSSQLTYVFGSWSTNPQKVALTYQVNNTQFAFSGTSSAADTSCLIPTVNQLAIGRRTTGNYWGGTIKKLSYYPARLTDAQLQALTTV